MDELQELYMVAMDAYDNEEYEKSIEFLDKILNNDPNANNALLMKASSLFSIAKRLFQEKEYDEAYVIFRESVSFNPLKSDSWHYMAMIKSFKGDLPAALRFINKAIDLEDEEPIFLNYKAVILNDMGEYSEAIRLFSSTIELAPKFIVPYYNLGSIYRKMEKYDLALEIFDKLLDVDSDNSKAFFEKSIIYYKTNDKELALKNINKALELNNENQEFIALKNIILGREEI